MFLENIILKHSGGLMKTSSLVRCQEHHKKKSILECFLENVILKYSGNLTKTSRWKHCGNILNNILRTLLEQ